jgi:hypothetical protein
MAATTGCGSGFVVSCCAVRSMARSCPLRSSMSHRNWPPADPETMDTYAHLFQDAEDLGSLPIDSALADALAVHRRNRAPAEACDASERPGQSPGGGRAGL